MVPLSVQIDVVSAQQAKALDALELLSRFERAALLADRRQQLNP